MLIKKSRRRICLIPVYVRTLGDEVIVVVVVVVVVVNCERTPKCKRSQFIFIQSKSGISVGRKSFSVSPVPL